LAVLARLPGRRTPTTLDAEETIPVPVLNLSLAGLELACRPLETSIFGPLDHLGINDRLAGGVWGHLVGDAMGLPYEFGPPVRLDQIRWGQQAAGRVQPPGTWSDDGGLMLALLDSLVQGHFDTRDQARRALDWWLGDAFKPGPVFDIGIVTRGALERIQRGIEPEEAGADGEDENGNGSLMRILPIALVGHQVPASELVVRAMRASSLTHRHPRSQVTCAVYVIAARNLIQGVSDRAHVLAQAFDTVEAAVGGAERRDLKVLQSYRNRTGTGYVVDCFWSAWEAFNGGNSYRDVIERAIAYGHDADTTACVAGGLAGIYWGMGAIPDEWLSGMRGRDVVEPILGKLLTLAGSPEAG
jgi:ADP-ribosyl-[dinitrogen reductase] hydrolase